MNLFAEIAISLFLVVSGVFGLVGSFGLVKLHRTMARLHAPTKATTLGVGGVLIASMINAYFALGIFSFHELMITLFLLMTAPITAHFIAKTHLHREETPDSLPPTGSDRLWASYTSDTDHAAADERV